MGAVKDFHIETMGLARDWEELIAQILSQANVGDPRMMRPEEEPDNEEDWEEYRYKPDLIYSETKSGEIVALELKLFRWRSEWRERVYSAIRHMREVLKRGQYPRGVIVLTLDVAPKELALLAAEAGEEIEIWDLAKLGQMSSRTAALASALEILASETMAEASTSVTAKQTTPVVSGAKLAEILRAIPPGDAGWREFEIRCSESITLLFGKNLHNFTAQQSSNEGLSRMDLVARIGAERDSFWSMIAADFRTRYIVFEAKNYEKPIGQSAIYVTSKYLFAKGLRTVAIIIAREGASNSAAKEAASQLRENGKLILTIGRADLCAMLEGFDAGDPPENRLFEIMDAMLMEMGR